MHPARNHCVTQLRTNKAGVEAVSAVSNRRFPRHAHDNYGLGLLDEGAHRSWSSLGCVEATAGDVITINPEEMHDGVPIANAARRWRMLSFDPALVAGELRQETAEQLEIAKPVLRDPRLRKELERLFALVTADKSDPLEIDESIVCVLSLVLQRHSTRNPHPQPSAPGIARARQRLDDAPCASASLAELAAVAGVSRFQLIRGFAREVGVTPHAYRLQRRVRLARRLIAGGRSLSEAAAETGFSDQSHMTRAFVRQMGMTPARYRASLA